MTKTWRLLLFNECNKYLLNILKMISKWLKKIPTHYETLDLWKRVLYSLCSKQVCAHGVVSFGLPVTSSNGSIPRGTGPPFIAVNWYPFQTYSSSSYNKGRVYYQSTTGTSGMEISGTDSFHFQCFYNVLFPGIISYLRAFCTDRIQL